MKAKIINVRLSEAIHCHIEEVAKVTASNKSFLTTDALTHYVPRESWQVRDIHEGVAQPILVNSQPKIGPRPCLPNTVLDPWI